MAQTVSLLLSPQDRAGLQEIVNNRRRPMKHVLRARIILLSGERLPVLEIAKAASKIYRAFSDSLGLIV
jgi:hypothetical protein